MAVQKFRYIFVSDSVGDGDDPYVRNATYTREQMVSELNKGFDEQWFSDDSHVGYDQVISEARAQIALFASGATNHVALPVPFGVVVVV